MVYRSATIVFAPARRGARAGERFGFSCSLGCVPVVRDFSTAASPSLEMTRLSTVPQGWRRDEGVPPYRNGKRHSKRVLARGVIPAGGRGTPLPILPKVSTGIADLPAGTSLPSSTCQRLTVIADLPTAHRHCRLANGSPSLPTCQRLTVIADLPSWRTNERETPCHFKAFPQSGKVDCRSDSEGKTDEGSG